MRLVFEQIRSGGDRNFGYLLGDREAGMGVLVDPSYSPEVFVERAQAQGLTVTHIVNTHSHPDHVNGNERAMALTGAPLAAHPLMRPDVPLADGADVRMGGLTFRILHVPGHCEDHIVLFEPTWRLALTGDLLFVGPTQRAPADRAARGAGRRHRLAHRRDHEEVGDHERSGHVQDDDVLRLLFVEALRDREGEPSRRGVRSTGDAERPLGSGGDQLSILGAW
jgi:glyoxylase-like metal-dependent hydrolase (beta-lactamase superfamily II)